MDEFAGWTTPFNTITELVILSTLGMGARAFKKVLVSTICRDTTKNRIRKVNRRKTRNTLQKPSTSSAAMSVSRSP